MKANIIGASGYGGGELIRILLNHPEIELGLLTSRSFAGKSVWKAHPNLRNVDLRFSNYDEEKVADADIVFTALPHKTAMGAIPGLVERGVKVVDFSADFRLKSAAAYEEWYGEKHTAPELLEQAVYGIPELHREEMKKASLIAGAGCEATSAILALAPLKGEVKEVIVDAKIGGAAAGREGNVGTHYPERANTVRPYAPASHRHAAEITQETGFNVQMSAHAVDLVRGILTTNHLVHYEADANDLRKKYKEFYADSPFIRVTPTAVQSLPNPKYVLGSNYCDLGFASERGHTVVFSALDNMIKGAAGQAVQCMNLMLGLKEDMGLEAYPIYPI